MVYSIAIVLGVVVSIEAGLIISGTDSYPDSGVVKVNSTYYIVTSLYGDILPLFKCEQLMECTLEGYAFDGIDRPSWINDSSFSNPEIHQIGPNYLLYFSTMNYTNRSYYKIGVAIAPHPLGPYTYSDEVLTPLANQSSGGPSIINDKGKYYLLWGSNGTINARQLNENGLSFSSDQRITLISTTFAWEGHIHSPWYIQRGSFHYLLYRTENCDTIGVSRSAQALGPYEKLPYPVVVNIDGYACIGDFNVVKGVDDENDAIIFSVQVNLWPWRWAVAKVSLMWNEDDWPYVPGNSNKVVA